MGTRGLMGFVADGGLKGSYMQYDSYPGGAGDTVLTWLRDVLVLGDERVAAQAVRNLVVVSEEDEPTAEDRVKYAHLWENVSNGDDWYALLRKNQGNPGGTLEAGVILDGLAFAADSLFCEWGYIVDFDARVLEVYKGFQDTEHAGGRFSHFPADRGYYGIRLIDTLHFDSLPEQMDSYEEDEDDE